MYNSPPPAIAQGIEVSEFCGKWMPALYRLKLYQPVSLKYPGDAGFTRQAAMFLVSLFPETVSESTFRNYITNRINNTPTRKILEFLLGQLDHRWSTGNLSSINPIADIELFCQNWRRVWWGTKSLTKSEMARFLSWVLAIAPKEATSLIESSKQSGRFQLMLLALSVIEEAWQTYIYRLHYNSSTFRKRA